MRETTLLDQQKSSQTLIHNLVFIDTTIIDYQSLIAGVIPETEVFVLHPQQDGIEQISAILRERHKIKSIHIVSHGSPSCLYLGNTQLNPDT
ncbi:MAG: DUF4347 domain-containing protein, partial [Spirulina sp.]